MATVIPTTHGGQRERDTLKMTTTSIFADRSSSSTPTPTPEPYAMPPLHPFDSSEPEADSTLAFTLVPRTSLFEDIFTSHPPVLESLLSHLPTRAIFDLYHTSHYLRHFLAAYPLAWRTLSFRLPQPPPILGAPQGMDTPDGRGERNSRQQYLNGLLAHVVVPVATRLTHLDLCNTAVDGVALCANVWNPRKETLRHMSVRGCKNVSIKYHLVPFLRSHNPQDNPWMGKEKLALTSLYTYRCRHHRRRPYLPSSLLRRDSDSEPTHDLIELCHAMGIWTDTAWCPTPGPRCYRRKDYHGNRAAPGTAEVWVPFDRLWRSQNRLGPVDDDRPRDANDGRLWEVAEAGSDGEVLHGLTARSRGEGKDMPAHTRSSHRMFVEAVKCDQCGDAILERCETCSVRQHCMGCRKTLCASCAFNRPVPRKRCKVRNFQMMMMQGMVMHDNVDDSASSVSSVDSSTTTRNKDVRRRHKFWWAPGAQRSPNLMSELSDSSESDDSDSDATTPTSHSNATAPLRLNMQWCCLEPIFSGGGGIAFLGPGLGGRGAEKVRAAPLPKLKQYADPDFLPGYAVIDAYCDLHKGPSASASGMSLEQIYGEAVDIVPYLRQDNVELQTLTCPRSLCAECYSMPRWKVGCKGCRRALCKEHDFRGLKVRKCGWRDLTTEREWIRGFEKRRGGGGSGLVIPAFKGGIAGGSGAKSVAVDSTGDEDAASTVAGEPSMSRQGSSSTEAPPAMLDLSSSVAALDGISSNGNSSTANRYASASSTSSTALSPVLPKPRSQSFSGLRKKTTLATTLAQSLQMQGTLPMGDRFPLPLPGTPQHPVQWEGCGGYYCQAPRPVGDGRMRCSAGMRLCGDCGVWVCESCLISSPPCPCAFCTANYTCPHCANLPGNKSRCRREEELQARKAAEQARRQLREMQEEFARRDERAAEMVNEFFRGVSGAVGFQQAPKTGNGASHDEWLAPAMLEDGGDGVEAVNEALLGEEDGVVGEDVGAYEPGFPDEAAGGPLLDEEGVGVGVEEEDVDVEEIVDAGVGAEADETETETGTETETDDVVEDETDDEMLDQAILW